MIEANADLVILGGAIGAAMGVANHALKLASDAMSRRKNGAGRTASAPDILLYEVHGKVGEIHSAIQTMMQYEIEQGRAQLEELRRISNALDRLGNRG